MIDISPKPITLATLPSATEQEIFDWVVFNLLRQDAKSVAPSNSFKICMYRGVDGRKCAAGWCIADEEYDESLDITLSDSTWQKLVTAGRVPSEHSTLIRELQIIHDTCEVEDWRGQFSELALSYNLSTEVME